MSLGPVVICKPYSKAYHDAFKSRGFDPQFVQVLDTRFVNEHGLRSVMQAGPEGKWSGVIVTSSRAAEAWISVAKSLLDDAAESHTTVRHRVTWETMPFYVVGKATEEALKAAPPPFCPQKILGGQSGSGETLAEYIVSSYAPENDPSMTGSLDNEFHNTRDPKLPLLYLTGDKNRETIPKRLSEVALECHKMQVYETSPAPDLSEKLKEVSTAVIVNTNEGGDTIPPWLVLFSPSTAEAVIGVLSESVVQFSETKQVGNESSILSSFQIASIGPTTRKYLADNSHRVAASAPKPDAESLAQAILDQVISDQ